MSSCSTREDGPSPPREGEKYAHFLPWARLHSLHFTKCCKAKQRAEALCFYPNASARSALSTALQWDRPRDAAPPLPEPPPSPYPLGQLRVHHEVVDVLLSFGELQLSGHHGHHQGRAAGALQGQGDTGMSLGDGVHLHPIYSHPKDQGATCKPQLVDAPHTTPPSQPPPTGCTNPAILMWATQFNPGLQQHSASHHSLEQLPELPIINEAD